jgi:hypothetical protein
MAREVSRPRRSKRDPSSDPNTDPKTNPGDIEVGPAGAGSEVGTAAARRPFEGYKTRKRVLILEAAVLVFMVVVVLAPPSSGGGVVHLTEGGEYVGVLRESWR